MCACCSPKLLTLLCSSSLYRVLADSVAWTVPRKRVFVSCSAPHEWISTQRKITKHEVTKSSIDMACPSHVYLILIISSSFQSQESSLHRRREQLVLTLQSPMCRCMPRRTRGSSCHASSGPPPSRSPRPPPSSTHLPRSSHRRPLRAYKLQQSYSAAALPTHSPTWSAVARGCARSGSWALARSTSASLSASRSRCRSTSSSGRAKQE